MYGSTGIRFPANTPLGRMQREEEDAKAQAAGFVNQQAQQQNRTLRNTIDMRATTSGISWKEAESAYSKKFGRSPNLTSNQDLQELYNYMGTGTGGLQKQKDALAAQAAITQADIAKQLKIVQSEKSAVSKMTEEYTAMLQKEADAKAKAQEAARVSAATSAANQSRQGQTSNLQIQPASSTSKTAGTQPFKRRQLQFNPQTYGGVSSMKSGTLNI